MSLADESRGLKDELDVLRHTAEQVVKYEAQIESYKKKMGKILKVCFMEKCNKITMFIKDSRPIWRN